MKKQHTTAITQRFLQLCTEVIQEGHVTSRKEFAESIGEYATNLAMMEKNKRSPTLEQIVSACKKYGYSANWIMLNMGQKKLSETVKASTGSLEQRVNIIETEITRLTRILARKQAPEMVNGLRTNKGQKRVKHVTKPVKT